MYAAIDAGNRNTKFYDGKQLIKFPSAIGINELQRNLKGQRKPFDFEWEYEGKCGFAGTLAEDESEYAESRKDDSKAHFDALLRIDCFAPVRSGDRVRHHCRPAYRDSYR